MTPAEIEALQSSGLSRETPYAIENVSQSQFSVARYYGSCTYQGAKYRYDMRTDTLVRDDVICWLAKWGLAQKLARRKAAQGALF